MENKKICFINGANPKFLGGISLYQKNLLNYIKKKDTSLIITWIYKSFKDEKASDGSTTYVGFNCGKIPFMDDIIFNIKSKNYLNKNYFNIINSHAIWGTWMKSYKKQNNQKIIHTYHGATYPYYKVHLKRFNLIKRIFLSPLLLYGYLIEKTPIKNADNIVCVSEKVKKEINETYNSKRKIEVLRTGVDLKEFKLRNKEETRKKLNLDKEKIYGLYIGKGGYWIKGLDRAVEISQEIYNKNKNYRLIVIGADRNKVGDLINKKFVIYIENAPRETIPLYYNASDFLLFLSRYEGGAPTLVVSEAMASRCLIICSEDSQQEIIQDNKNGLVLSNFSEDDAKRIINLIRDKRNQQKIRKYAIKTIKEFSIDKWGEEYSKIILK